MPKRKTIDKKPDLVDQFLERSKKEAGVFHPVFPKQPGDFGIAKSEISAEFRADLERLFLQMCFEDRNFGYSAKRSGLRLRVRLGELPEHCLADKDFILAYFRSFELTREDDKTEFKDAEDFTCLKPELQADRVVVLAAVARCGLVLQFVSQEFRTDEEIVSAAFEQDPKSFEFAADSLRKSPEFVLSLLQNTDREELSAEKIFNFLDPALQSNKEIIKLLVSYGGIDFLPKIPAGFATDMEVLACLSRDQVAGLLLGLRAKVKKTLKKGEKNDSDDSDGSVKSAKSPEPAKSAALAQQANKLRPGRGRPIGSKNKQK